MSYHNTLSMCKLVIHSVSLSTKPFAEGSALSPAASRVAAIIFAQLWYQLHQNKVSIANVYPVLCPADFDVSVTALQVCI